MTKRWSLLLYFAFSMLSTACSSNEDTQKQEPSTPEVDEVVARAQQPIKIVCVGNSITEGFGNTCQEKAWPGQLGKRGELIWIRPQKSIDRLSIVTNNAYNSSILA